MKIIRISLPKLLGKIGSLRKGWESNPHAISDAGLANLWLTIRRTLPEKSIAFRWKR